MTLFRYAGEQEGDVILVCQECKDNDCIPDGWDLIERINNNYDEDCDICGKKRDNQKEF